MGGVNRRTIAGGSISPIISSSFHNAVLDRVFGAQQNATELPTGSLARNYTELLVQNGTGQDVEVGDVFAVADPNMNADKDDDDGNPDMPFENVIFIAKEIGSLHSHVRSLYGHGIFIEPGNAGDFVRAYLPNWIQAKVRMAKDNDVLRYVPLCGLNYYEDGHRLVQGEHGLYPFILIDKEVAQEVDEEADRWCLVKMSTPIGLWGTVSTEITPKTKVDDTTVDLGSGFMSVWEPRPIDGKPDRWERMGGYRSYIKLYNMTEATVEVDQFIQAKPGQGGYFVDVEECG